MPIAESLLPELDHELAATRRILERVPEEDLAWKPHEKSMSLGRLATHVAEIPTWAEWIFTKDERDIAPPGAPPYVPRVLASTTEIVALSERSGNAARAAILATPDAEFATPWSVKAGGRPLLTLPRGAMYRTVMMNHLIHHRGQLSVYLRLRGVPVPGMYGPSADEALVR